MLAPSLARRPALAQFVAVSVVAVLSPVGSVRGLHAQSASEAGTGHEGPEPAGGIPTMLAHETRGPITVDGRLDEAVWSEIPSWSGFVQKEPVEGAPAINDSEVWLLFDDDAVYVGALLHDDSPETIARNMVRRDSNYDGQFDYFEVFFDPNLDRRTGYRFRVSAANVQADRYLFDDAGEDSAWDAVWTSAVAVDDRGWTVEMRIPLSQMRYQTADTAQTWGVNFGRRRAADNELTRFALESRLRRGRVSQFGLLQGVVVRRSPRRLELRPYVVTSAHRGPSREGDPFFDGREVDGRAGLELRYGLGTSFTLDATINPDFGQVEADPAVINLSAFETFFQERRPFFVEDARVFDFRLSGGSNSLFYSRRVGRPPQGRAPSEADFADVPEATTILGAAKLTGRTGGGLSVGALVSLTGRERGRAFFADRGVTEHFDAEPRSTYGVVRLEQDFRDGASNVGGIVTAMGRSLPADGSFDFLPSSAFTAGVDFEHNWGDRRWALWGFVAASHVRGDSTAMIRIQRASNHYRQRPDLRWAQLDSAATSLTGAEWRLQLERRGGRWTGAVWAAEVTSGFEINDLGFSTVNERLDGGARITYQEVTPGRYLHDYSLSAFTFHNWSHEALRDLGSLDRWGRAHTAGRFTGSANLTFLNFWTLGAEVGYTPETMSRTATRGGPRMVMPAAVRWGIELGTDNRKRVSVRPSLDVTRGFEGSGEELRARLTTTIQPSSRLQVQVQPTFTRQTDGAQYVATTSAVSYAPTYGARYLFAELHRRDVSMVTRLNWTFTPKLTLQLFAQPLLSSGDYVTYKQLSRAETYRFDRFEEGRAAPAPPGSGVGCIAGRTCEDPEGGRHFDFDGDGVADYSMSDLDFNVRSLRATAVLRWEYRPGSTFFFVWQRRQAEEAAIGDFDLGRDLGAMLGAPSDDVFIVKVNVWLSM